MLEVSVLSHSRNKIDAIAVCAVAMATAVAVSGAATAYASELTVLNGKTAKDPYAPTGGVKTLKKKQPAAEPGVILPEPPSEAAATSPAKKDEKPGQPKSTVRTITAKPTPAPRLKQAPKIAKPAEPAPAKKKAANKPKAPTILNSGKPKATAASKPAEPKSSTPPKATAAAKPKTDTPAVDTTRTLALVPPPLPKRTDRSGLPPIARPAAVPRTTIDPNANRRAKARRDQARRRAASRRASERRYARARQRRQRRLSEQRFYRRCARLDYACSRGFDFACYRFDRIC